MADIQSVSRGLKLRGNGIWSSKDTENISYPSDGNEAYFAIEDNSFWFRHRNHCIVSIANSFPPKNNGTIFDIGGGNGCVSFALANAGFDVALVEPGASGASKAKSRGIKNVICATTNTARFKPHSLPAVGLFDVIEHIEDDLSFLKSIKDLLKQEGYLYATVPSYSFLWSEEDVSAGHFRRYTVEGISKVLKSAGFQIEFCSYIFRFLPLPLFFLRTLPYRVGFSMGKKKNNISRDHAAKGGVTGKILDSLLKPEIENLNKKIPMMFGSSCLIVAKSPKEIIRQDFQKTHGFHIRKNRAQLAPAPV